MIYLEFGLKWTGNTTKTYNDIDFHDIYRNKNGKEIICPFCCESIHGDSKDDVIVAYVAHIRNVHSDVQVTEQLMKHYARIVSEKI